MQSTQKLEGSAIANQSWAFVNRDEAGRILQNKPSKKLRGKKQQLVYQVIWKLHLLLFNFLCLEKNKKENHFVSSSKQP